MLKTWFYLLIVIAVTLLAVVFLIRTGPESQATLQPQPPQHVVTDIVRTLDFRPLNRQTGQLQPARRARLHFEVTGQISERHVEPGQEVEQGEILLTLASGDFDDAVTETQALLEQERNAIARDRRLLELVEDQVALQAREVDRMDRLGRDSLASKSAYDTARQALLKLESEAAQLRNNVDSAAARLQQREAAYNRALRDQERTQLTAPFKSTVNEVAVDAGDYVTPGQMALKLVQLDELDLALEVAAAAGESLALQQEINVRVDDQQKSGVIVALAPEPDPVTHTYALRIRLPAGDWFPGQLALAELPGRYYEDARIVPAGAVLRDGGETYVFRLDDDQLQRLPVTVVRRYLDWQVVEGVEPGIRVVARDVAALADGQTVTVD